MIKVYKTPSLSQNNMDNCTHKPTPQKNKRERTRERKIRTFIRINQAAKSWWVRSLSCSGSSGIVLDGLMRYPHLEGKRKTLPWVSRQCWRQGDVFPNFYLALKGACFLWLLMEQLLNICHWKIKDPFSVQNVSNAPFLKVHRAESWLALLG